MHLLSETMDGDQSTIKLNMDIQEKVLALPTEKTRLAKVVSKTKPTFVHNVRHQNEEKLTSFKFKLIYWFNTYMFLPLQLNIYTIW